MLPGESTMASSKIVFDDERNHRTRQRKTSKSDDADMQTDHATFATE